MICGTKYWTGQRSFERAVSLICYVQQMSVCLEALCGGTHRMMSPWLFSCTATISCNLLYKFRHGQKTERCETGSAWLLHHPCHSHCNQQFTIQWDDAKEANHTRFTFGKAAKQVLDAQIFAHYTLVGNSKTINFWSGEDLYKMNLGIHTRAHYHLTNFLVSAAQSAFAKWNYLSPFQITASEKAREKVMDCLEVSKSDREHPLMRWHAANLEYACAAPLSALSLAHW